MFGAKLDAEREARALVQIAAGYNMGPRELKPPLAEWGRYYLAQMPGMFQRGGRGPVKWARLKPSTIASRRLRGISHSRPLASSNRIERSIRTETLMGLGGAVQHVFSHDRLAAIHHAGALIGPRTIEARNVKALRFQIGGKIVFAKRVHLPMVEIPARPITFITDHDRVVAVSMIRKFVEKKIRSRRKK